ncbi:MAG TPA: DUF2293 domain-containing protein [Vicinamibacterales bacterium]|nr:DUF2293 domain-containing protein [Vicinamibacterales bacterium]
MPRPHVDVDAGVRHDSGVKRAADASREREIVVFWIVRDSVCGECGQELGRGRFLRLEAQRPLCLSCADLDHLVFLERGDAALTRRASRYSTLRAVVVRFSRARKRYERQGVLVEDAALTRAERECLADADARQRAQERAAEQRDQHDAEYIAAFGRRVGELFPRVPIEEQRAIAEHACQKYSGRVGRSAAAKEFQAGAIELAVRAHVRHVHTRYDELLAHGMAREDARARVAASVAQCLETWQRGEATDEDNGS